MPYSLIIEYAVYVHNSHFLLRRERVTAELEYGNFAPKARTSQLDPLQLQPKSSAFLLR